MWVIWDIRDGDKPKKCEHCGKMVSTRYVVIHPADKPLDKRLIGVGCVKAFTGRTLKELKQDTLDWIRGNVQ